MLAPAIVGKRQFEVGYIPCRIFKNISYGNLGITNSHCIAEFLGESIIYDSDNAQLARKAIKTLGNPQLSSIIYNQMENVKQNHTYLNRISAILDFFTELKNID